MDRRKFVAMRLFGKPGGNPHEAEFYLWGVYSDGRRFRFATIKADATTAGYMASAVADSMYLPLYLTGAWV